MVKLQLRNGGVFELSGIREIVVKRRKFWYRVEGPHGIEWLLEEAPGNIHGPPRVRTRKMGSVAISHNDMLDYIAQSTKKKNLHVWACGETINIDRKQKKRRAEFRRPIEELAGAWGSDVDSKDFVDEIRRRRGLCDYPMMEP